VTRRGKPVVRLVAAQPVDAASRRARVADAFRQLRQLRRTVSLEGDLKAIAREGLD
jgi:antitoxin (DNA-binding transcriptional repressor) of toxin-antitoxin stability system